MARMTFDELNEILDQALDAGEIHNAEFGELKTYRASRLLHDDIDIIRARFMNAGKYQDRTPEECAAIESLSDSIVQFPTKKTMKIIGSALYEGVFAAVIDLVTKWKPVGEKFRTLKPLIVKGRRPSSTPQTGKVRSLENTGTCAVCGRNVKMDSNGKMVSHGFTIRYGFQNGNCFGVGHDPIEVSPKGAIAYAKMTMGMIVDHAFAVKHIEETSPVISRTEGYGRNVKHVSYEAGDEKYEMVKKARVQSLLGDIRHMNHIYASFTSIIEKWTPGTLPG